MVAYSRILTFITHPDKEQFIGIVRDKSFPIVQEDINYLTSIGCKIDNNPYLFYILMDTTQLKNLKYYVHTIGRDEKNEL